MFGLHLGLGLDPPTVGASWDPSQLSPAGWFRADTGNTTTWTDKSGNSHDATWSSAPTATTLGGQAAWDMSGGKHADNTTSNLITAGGAFTVLVVGKVTNTTGGAVWTSRLTAPYASVQLFDNSGNTFAAVFFAYSDGATQSVTLNPVGTAGGRLTSPFKSELAFAGSGIAPTVTVDSVGYSVTGGVQAAAETGTTGFQIGTNSNNQAWGSILAELVILNRALTSGERTSWNAYVLARYGI